MKFGIFYFSATGITNLFAKKIQQSLEKRDYKVEILNILYPWNQKMQILYEDYDGCFFGFPVFGGRLPSVAERWLEQQDGNKTPCAMFFTYGGRLLENANQITAYLLKKSNFRLVLSSEYLGKHSFNVAPGWNLCEDRPNEADFQVADEFSERSVELFKDKNRHFQINLDEFQYHPQLLKKNNRRSYFHPSRMGQSCSMCLQCEVECPTQAMTAESGEVDPIKCLKCMHCVVICPDSVLKLEDVSNSFDIFQKRNHLTPEVTNRKQSLIYSSFPEKK